VTTPRRRRLVVGGCGLALLAVVVSIGVALERLHVLEPRVRHGTAVYWLAFSRDGSRLFSISPEENKFLLRDLENPYERWHGARRSHQGVAIWGTMSSDGKFALFERDEDSPKKDRVCELFDLEHWRSVRLVEPGEVAKVAFSPDARRFAWASDTQLHVGALPGGETIASRPKTWKHGETGLAFADDGRRLAVGEDSAVLLEDAVSGAPIRRFPLTAETEDVYGLAFSPDQRTLVAAVSMVLIAFDVTTGTQRWRVPVVHDAQVRTLDFSPDGRLVFCRADLGVLAYEASTGKQVGFAQQDDYLSVAFAPEGGVAALGRPDGSIDLMPTDAFLARFR
jgi:WD40 repeat protein